jgi:hypothetical protein
VSWLTTEVTDGRSSAIPPKTTWCDIHDWAHVGRHAFPFFQALETAFILSEPRKFFLSLRIAYVDDFVGFAGWLDHSRLLNGESADCAE